MPYSRYFHLVKKLWPVVLVSWIAAYLSYMILFFVSGYASLYFAYDFDIAAYFGLSGVIYLTPPEHPDWTFDAVVTVLLSKPLTAFFLGLSSIVALLLIKCRNTFWFYFFVWMAIWGFNLSLGAVVDDAIFKVGTYAVAEVMNFSLPAIIISGFVSAYLLYLLGVIIARFYLQYIKGVTFYTEKRRFLAISLTIVFPWISVGLLSFSSWIPAISAIELSRFAIAVVIIAPMYFVKESPGTQQTYSCAKPGWLDVLSVLPLFFFVVWIILKLFDHIVLG